MENITNNNYNFLTLILHYYSYIKNHITLNLILIKNTDMLNFFNGFITNTKTKVRVNLFTQIRILFGDKFLG